MPKLHVASVWAGFVALNLSNPVSAQSLSEPDASRLLKPIVVSASRGVAQTADDTPASVDAIDAQTLQTGQAQVNLSETLSRVPGLVAQSRQNYAQDLQISSRGFGARSSFGVRGLRLYTDGIPASGPDGQGQVSHFDIGSAQRVEVLRGPFSSLYGNSSGGVISLYTADGGPQTVAEVTTLMGSYGTQRLGLKLSGTQGKVQYNISAAGFSTDGSRPHSAATRDTFNGKFKIALQEATNLTVVLNSISMPNAQDPLGLSRAELQANPRQVTPTALSFNTRKSVDQTQGGLVLDHRLGGGQSLQFTAYMGERSTQQFQSIPVATQAAAASPGGVIDLGRHYQGLDARWINQTTLMDKPLTITAGLATDTLKEARKGYQNFIGSNLGVLGALRRDENNTVSDFDQYVQAQWNLAERWSLSAGLRHSRVAFDSADRYIVPGNGNDSGSVSYQATTPALGLVYHANDAVNLYAAMGQGFETPTLNELAYRAHGATGMNFGLQSASSRQWELGVKADLTPQWHTNVAYFQARTANEIAVLTNSGGRSTYQNVGATLRQGFEASLKGKISEAWTTAVAATMLDATYQNRFLTCVASPCTNPTTVVAAGNRIPGIPRSNLYAELAWHHRPWGMEAAIEWRRIGAIATDDANTDTTPTANVYNLRLSWAQKIDRWTLREFIRIDNLTNLNYVGSVIVNESNGRFFEPAPGRNNLVGITAAYTF